MWKVGQNSPFSNERHFEIWFPKKKIITFFQKKITLITQKRHNFACDNYIFPKTRGNKNKQRTHLGALNAPVPTYPRYLPNKLLLFVQALVDKYEEEEEEGEEEEEEEEERRRRRGRRRRRKGRRKSVCFLKNRNRQINKTKTICRPTRCWERSTYLQITELGKTYQSSRKWFIVKRCRRHDLNWCIFRKILRCTVVKRAYMPNFVVRKRTAITLSAT